MGIKLLILQMIPWCFPMGNTTACHQQTATSSPAATTGGGGGGDGKASKHLVKLIMADGTVEVYHRSVSAAELMIGHPMHLVCRSDAFTIGERIPALAEGEQLQLGHAYFLLPAHFFQSVLSFVTLASSIALLQQRPFDVHKTPSGSLQIRVSDEFIGKMEEEETQQGDGGGGGRVCTTAALEKDYQQLVAGSRARQWKPKLETIRESERWRGRLVAVGGAAAALGDIGRRRNKEREKQQQQQQQEQRRRQQKQLKLRQQEEEEEHKVSTVSLLLGSPHPPRSEVIKKVVACDL